MEDIGETKASTEGDLLSTQHLGAVVQQLEILTLYADKSEPSTFHGVIRVSEEPVRWTRVFTERDEAAARALAGRLDASLRPFASRPSDGDQGDQDEVEVERRRRELPMVARCLLEKPQWSPASVAVHCGMPRALSHPDIRGTIDEPAGSGGESLLMFSVTGKRMCCVTELLRLGADANAADEQGSLAIHRLARLAQDDVATVKLEVSPYTTPEYRSRRGPVHRQAIHELVDRGVDQVNVRDGAGSEPLHVAARSGSLVALLALLANGADVNAREAAGGDTPLHLAVQSIQKRMSTQQSSDDVLKTVQDLCDVVKALVLFRTDLEVKNNDGRNVWSIAKDLDEGATKVLVLSLLQHGQDYERASAPLPATASGGGKTGDRVLCLDGGGMRGLILARILEFLWRINGQPNVSELFDWVAGTSTGGILALGVALGHNPPFMQQAYFRMKDTVFRGCAPYSVKWLQEAMQHLFGECLLESIQHPRVMVTCSKVDYLPIKLVLLKNYKDLSETLGDASSPPGGPGSPPSELRVWQAATWTASAPGLFEPLGDLVDGGLLANNPTLAALSEIHRTGRIEASQEPSGDASPPLAIVLSLGTGRRIPVHTGDPFPSTRWEWINPWVIESTFECFVSALTITEGCQLDAAKEWCRSITVPFYRESPLLHKFVKANETDNQTLINLLFEVDKFVFSHPNEMLSIAGLLRK